MFSEKTVVSPIIILALQKIELTWVIPVIIIFLALRKLSLFDQATMKQLRLASD